MSDEPWTHRKPKSESFDDGPYHAEKRGYRWYIITKNGETIGQATNQAACRKLIAEDKARD